MSKLKWIKDSLENIIVDALSEDISGIDACELGEVIDMLKDTYMSMYYHSVVEAMEESSNEEIIKALKDRLYFNESV